METKYYKNEKGVIALSGKHDFEGEEISKEDFDSSVESLRKESEEQVTISFQKSQEDRKKELKEVGFTEPQIEVLMK